MIKDQNINKLYDWMKSIGCLVENKYFDVRVVNESSRKVFAAEDIENGKLLGRLPVDVVISPYCKKVADVCKELPFETIFSEQPSIIALAFFLALDMKNPNSFFKPYYEVFPKYDVFNYLQFMPKETIDLIKGTQLYVEYCERMLNLENCYNLIKVNLDKHNISFEEFKKSLFYVYSRIFGVIKEDNSDVVYLLNPFYDLIDDGGKHRNVDYKYNRKEHAYDFTALRNIKKGEELFIDYGDFYTCYYNNIVLLLDYGFTFSDNVRKIRIEFELNQKKYKFNGEFINKDECEQLITKITNEQHLTRNYIVNKLKEILNDKIQLYQKIIKNSQLENEKNILLVIKEENDICINYLKFIGE